MPHLGLLFSKRETHHHRKAPPAVSSGPDSGCRLICWAACHATENHSSRLTSACFKTFLRRPTPISCLCGFGKSTVKSPFLMK
jgi:hypothetical protein